MLAYQERPPEYAHLVARQIMQDQEGRDDDAAGFPAVYLGVDPANFALLAEPEKQQPFEYLENGRVNKEQDDKCQDPALGVFRLEIDTQPSENRAEDEWGQMLYQMSCGRHCA
jgi:hypothetical protein